MSFNDLQLIDPVLRALSQEGYSEPTPIQERAIPSILQGRDLLGCAQTGTGKTAAFAIPILQLMFEKMQVERQRMLEKTKADQPLQPAVVQVPSDSGDGIEERIDAMLARRSQSASNGSDVPVANQNGHAPQVQQGHHRQPGQHGRRPDPRPQARIRALILTPTRELAIQIEESFKAYGRYLPLRHLVIFGGVSQVNQVNSLRRGIDILVATPGRLLDLMQQRHVSLQDIEFFVLDEADRMLDMGFVVDVKKIIARLPEKRQTLFFSATMPPEIQQLSKVLLTDPVRVEVTPVSSTAEKVTQFVFYTDKNHKRELLNHLLADPKIESALVFTRTKHRADRVVKDLIRAGFRAEAIHGNKSQNARQGALSNFKAKKTRVLVATDIAARGIDIDELTHVINYELPNIPETYVHRIGRTGRAGLEGTAFSFCDYEEKIFLNDIQRLIGQQIPVMADHPYHLPLMAITVPAAPAGASSSFKKMGGGKRRGRTFSQR